MKRVNLTSVLCWVGTGVFLSALMVNRVSAIAFAKTFGGSDYDWAYSVQQTSDGGYIVAGFTYSFGAGGDVFILKTDASGNLQWSKTFGGGDYEEAYSVQQTSDGGYIVAGYTLSFGAGSADVFLLKTDASGNLQWAKTFGGSSDDYALSVQQTSDGGYIVAGFTYSFGAGGDVFLLKTDASGNLQWAKTFGGSFDDWAYSVQQTSDGGYIVAGFTYSFGAGGDVFILKTDASGNLQWSKTFGGGDYEEAYSVQQTSDGGYIVAGVTGSFGAGGSDVFLLKTDASGNLQWSKTFGGSSGDYAYSVQQTSDGGYIVAGETNSFGAGGDVFLFKTDASGNLQWAKTFGGSSYEYAHSVQQTSDGGYIVAGGTYSFGAGNYDVFLLKTDASGNLQWAKTFGGSGWDLAYSVQQTSDGGYIVAGETYSFGAGSYDVFLLKTDASGNLQWAKTFGGSGGDYAWSVQQTSDGGYIMAGYTSSFGAGSYDVFLLKTDASGNLQWAKTFGGSNYELAHSVQQTSDGGYIVAGFTYSFGAGNEDVFLLKTDASGNLQWAKTFGGSEWDWAYSVQQTSDGGYIVVGFTYSFGAGSYDVFLLKTDANGNIGTCAIVGSVTPTVNTPSPTVTNPTPILNSPTPTVTTPSPTVTSPTLSVSEPCSLSISEEQRFDGCFADVLRVGKGHITVSSVGEFRVKIYDVSGNVVKDVEGKGVLRISLKKGVYFVEVVSREIKRAERVIVR